jgi:hypothetical protein
VAALTMPSCTQPDSVGPRLIEMINESKGCVGEEIALDKDGHDNQSNLAVLTMNDPQNTLRHKRAMVVGLGQWSDGRTSDYQKLVDRLEPAPQGGLGEGRRLRYSTVERHAKDSDGRVCRTIG